jgi:hypothetical protein
VELVVEHRFRGPAASGNGGYTCGLLANVVGEPAEVTLRLPPPLDRPLRVEHRGDTAVLLDGDAVVAEARRAVLDLDVPASPSFEEAARAAASSSRRAGAGEFRECFVCGPDRGDGDGLRIFPGELDGLVAAAWTPADETPRAVVWAAIDCPGAFALEFGTRDVLVLGRLTAEVTRVPRSGERCVVVGWPLGEKGRKRNAGTALFGDGGDLLARGRAVWIAPR